MTERHGPSWARRFAEPVRRVRAKGEPAGCDRSRKGITGEQKTGRAATPPVLFAPLCPPIGAAAQGAGPQTDRP